MKKGKTALKIHFVATLCLITIGSALSVNNDSMEIVSPITSFLFVAIVYIFSSFLAYKTEIKSSYFSAFSIFGFYMLLYILSFWSGCTYYVSLYFNPLFTLMISDNKLFSIFQKNENAVVIFAPLIPSFLVALGIFLRSLHNMLTNKGLGRNSKTKKYDDVVVGDNENLNSIE